MFRRFKAEKLLFFCLAVILTPMTVLSWAEEPPLRLVQAEFHIEHRPLGTIIPAIQKALSPKGELALHSNASRPGQILILTDTPQNMTALRALVKHLDVPLRKLEITVKLIEASRAENPPPVADEIRDLGSRLKNVLRFTQYRLLDKGVIESLEGHRAEIRLAGNYRVSFDMDYLLEEGQVIPVKSFRFEKMSPSRGKSAPPTYHTLLATALNLINGEEIIFGASQMDPASPNSFILVLSAKVI